MSDDALEPRYATYHGVNDIRGWKVKLYSFAAPGVSVDDSPEFLGTLTRQCLANFEESGFTDEFTYFRFGFMICHIGRRGITVSLTHFGLWVDMPEVFASTWYCYGHSGDELERLDFREPLTCFHEIPTMMNEILLFRRIVHERAKGIADISWEEVASSYLNSGAIGHNEELHDRPEGFDAIGRAATSAAMTPWWLFPVLWGVSSLRSAAVSNCGACEISAGI